jgi:hypothetical protein
VAAGDHDVVIAVGYEDRLPDLPEVVGRLQAGREFVFDIDVPLVELSRIRLSAG